MFISGTELTEEYIIREFRNGNYDPLGKWLMGCTKIRNYIQSMIPECDRDDIFQEVAAGVVKNLHGFRGKSSLLTFTYRVAINKCADYWRSPYRSFKLSPNLSRDGNILDPNSTINVLVIKDAINRLPSKQKEIMLYLVHNTDGGHGSISQVADHYEITYSAARSRIRRARDAVRCMVNT